MTPKPRARVLPVLLFAALLAHAQPAMEWQHPLGGTSDDAAYVIQQTTDGGYIMAGYTESNDWDVIGQHGNGDCWVTKLDGSGTLQWQHALGGTASDDAVAIQQTTDGGYIMAGHTYSNDGDVSGSHGDDAWVVKLDGSGTLQWQHALGGTEDDGASAIRQTTDGGYIMAGYTYSNDGDVSGNHSGGAFQGDAWVVKLDGTGTLQWQHALGGTDGDYGSAIQQTADGGYIMAGSTNSNDGDVAGFHVGSSWFYGDAWVVKLDGSGTLQWQHALGGTNSDAAYAIQETADGGYILAGYAGSNDVDVSGNHGNGDAWVVKLDTIGTLQWQHALGGTDEDYAFTIQQTTDGGYIMAGKTESNDGDVSGNHGGDLNTLSDAWVVKLNGSGTIQWQKCLGGSGSEIGNAIKQTTDGGYIMAGHTHSNNGDVSGKHGGWDAWVVKLGLDQIGIAEQQAAVHVALYPNPAEDAVHVQFQLPNAAPVALNVLDAAGRLVGTFPEERLPAGQHELSYSLNALPPGLYELRLEVNGKRVARKVVKR